MLNKSKHPKCGARTTETWCKVTKKREKSERKKGFSFAFPSASNFGEAKVTKKACKKKAILED